MSGMFVRGLATAIIGLIAAVALPNWANADYPERSIRGIVGFGAGGQLDTVARIIADRLSEEWGQRLVIENRPGAGSDIGAELAAQAQADGYTIFFATQATAVNTVLAPSQTFDATEDLAPVIHFASSQVGLLVPASLPIQTLDDLVDYAQERPGELNYAATGPGTPGNIGMAMLNEMLDIDVQPVFYREIAQAAADVVGGRIEVWLTTLAAALPHIESGAVRLITVSGDQRLAAFPDVPTIAESGVIGFESPSWYAVFVPTGTPDDVVSKLNEDFRAVLQVPEVRERLEQMGVDPLETTPEDLDRRFSSMVADLRRLVDAGAIEVTP